MLRHIPQVTEPPSTLQSDCIKVSLTLAFHIAFLCNDTAQGFLSLRIILAQEPTSHTHELHGLFVLYPRPEVPDLGTSREIE